MASMEMMTMLKYLKKKSIPKFKITEMLKVSFRRAFLPSKE